MELESSRVGLGPEIMVLAQSLVVCRSCPGGSVCRDKYSTRGLWMLEPGNCLLLEHMPVRESSLEPRIVGDNLKP